jgi:beta-N-acetylhexosaminidase
MNQAGMRSVGKHFPGHGFCTRDSHVEYPSDPRDADAILNADTLPYRSGSGVGIDAVMTAHVQYPAADPEIATYSPYWLSEVLRGRIGFQGLVVSDDLHMAGAAGAGGMPRRIRSAAEAGCDLVLVCHEWDRDRSERELPCSAKPRNPWLDLAPPAASADERELEAARARIAAFGHG